MKTMKTALRLTIAACGLALLNVLVATGQAQDYTYEIDNGTVTVTRYTGPGGDVIIPATFDGLPVTRIGGWYGPSDYQGAFQDCLSLISVTMPSSITNIGLRAFSGCGNLTGVAIPSGVTIIAGGAFMDCTNLATVSIPNSVIAIQGGAFRGCTNLTSLSIPDSVNKIEAYAFWLCRGLTNVTIGSGLNSINWRLIFSGASGCSSLRSIDIDASNPAYSSVEGVVFDKPQTVLILCPKAKAGGCVIPDSVTDIAAEAFASCDNLTSVTIGNKVASIGPLAFGGCRGLTTVTIPPSVRSIGEWAFSGCASLKGVYFQGNAPAAGIFGEDNNVTVHYLPGTTGWGATFGGRPTALWIPTTPNLPSLATDNPLKLVTHSPAPATVRVQRSTNLRDWEDWQTVTRDGGPSELHDDEAGTTPYRFYRGLED